MSESAGRGAEQLWLRFGVSPEAYADLVRMREEYDAKSFADVVRDALYVYDWLKKRQSEGYKLGLIKDEKLEKLVELTR